jgi:hypothetical protein
VNGKLIMALVSKFGSSAYVDVFIKVRHCVVSQKSIPLGQQLTEVYGVPRD